MAPREHTIAMSAGGKQVTGWTEYQIDTGLLDPADTFSLSLPITKDARIAWDTVRPDRLARILIDGTARITGFIDEANGQIGEGAIHVSGRCKAGRLVQTSAPAVNYDGLTLFGFLAELAKPEFAKVTPSNARNRKLLRGRGHHASSRDAVFLDARSSKRIEPGQMRWEVMEDLCKQAGYTMWSSGDGAELVVGQPDYSQEVQFHFFNAAHGSGRADATNVKDLGVRRSTADRYSRILVLGSGAGTDANYGLAVAARAGEWKDNAATAQGDGADFSAPKVLVISDQDVKSAAEAKHRAELEAASRNLHREVLMVTAALHGQRVAGARDFTLFTPDTMAYVEDEVLGIKGTYLIASCSYRSSRNDGETTVMELFPKGTVIAA
jgi:prophage tail gpP-like protein